MYKYLETIGIIAPSKVYHNLTPAILTEIALERKEGTLSNTGALVITTGKYTGRSPNDRFVVDTPNIHDDIDWGDVNVPISSEIYEGVRKRITAYLQNKELFVFDGFAGADKKYQQKIRVINELASQNLFIRNLLLRPDEEELKNFGKLDFTIIAVPGFNCVPSIDGTNSEAAILLNIDKREVLICGTQYAGEIKKSVFSFMNYLLPKNDVLSMHCSANVGDKEDVTVFFGLSGTGKTTLSAVPDRKLIGDDEHGWSANGVFNIEGGCYAKCINLSKENEPEIWNAIKAGSVVENVVMDPITREFDFADSTLAENSRVGYPIEYIPNALRPSSAGHPTVIIFLTADAFGVLPPVAKLSREQAKYHFVSGYTSKLAGTERGVTVPQTTFSTCFGAPFLPLHPSVYADMLGTKIDKHNTDVYLVNTGWSGGPYGIGSRMSIKLTRSIVNAAINGELAKVEYKNHPELNIEVPQSCPGIDPVVLNPRETWTDKAAYDIAARDLANRFIKNFEKYEHMPQSIIDAGPRKK